MLVGYAQAKGVEGGGGKLGEAIGKMGLSRMGLAVMPVLSGCSAHSGQPLCPWWVVVMPMEGNSEAQDGHPHKHRVEGKRNGIKA